MKIPPALKWSLALVLTILLFYWRLFFTSQYSLLCGVEETNQAFSWLNFWIHSLRHGTLPLWDPYTYAGYLFPGEMQTSAFNPVYLIALLFPLTRDGMLSPMEYHILFLLGHIMAALFMFALIRELGLSNLAAFISGLCFSVGGLVGRAIWLDMIQSSAWLPLIFLFLLRSLKQTNTRRFVSNGMLAGLCLGLSVLGGRLHMTIAQGIFIVTGLAFFAGRQSLPSGAARWIGRPWPRAAALAAITIVTGAFAGAIQLLPSFLYSRHSIRFYGEIAFPSTQKPPYMYTTPFALWPSGILSVLFPSFDLAGQGEVWPPYIGVLPFLLAVVAIVRCWSNLWVRYLLGLTIAAMFYSLAWSSALHGVLYSLVPYLWIVREATRFLYLAAFSLAVLAAFGVDQVFTGISWPDWPVYRKVLLRIAAGAVFALLLGVFWPKTGSYWVQFSCLMILASSVLLWYMLSGPRRVSTGLRAVAVALIFFDLSAWSWNIYDKIAAGKAGTDHHELLTSLRGASGFLKRQPQLQPFRVHIFRDPRPNIGDSFGIQTDSGTGATLAAGFSKINGNFDLLNVRYFIKPASSPDPSPIYSDPQWKIFENPNALSRAWLVHRVSVEHDDDLLYRNLGAGKIDPRQAALLSSPLPRPIAASGDTQSEAVDFTSYAAHSFSIAVHAGSPALLVISEMYWPEWHAFVNGQETPIYRADGALRSILVPGGKSIIRFVYRPWSFYIGALLTAVAFLATLLISRSANSTEPRA